MPTFAGEHVRRLPLLKLSSKECGKTGLPQVNCSRAHERIHVRAHTTRVWSSVREASWPSRCWSLSRDCWQSVPIVFTADQTTKWTRTGTAAVGQSSQAKQSCYSNHTDITAHLMLPCTHHIPSSAKLDSAVLTSHSSILKIAPERMQTLKWINSPVNETVFRCEE